MDIIDGEKLQDVTSAAKLLLGCTIIRMLPDGSKLSGMIVETEGYHQEDPASHTYKGQTPRNSAMFGPAAHAYVYFTYGMHWCLNVTAGVEGYGAGVLIRAIEPISGIDKMRQFRKNVADKNLTNGPGKLAQALAIDKSLYGHDLTQKPLQVYEPVDRNFEIIESTRIGISKAVDELARFYIKDNAFVSRL